MKDEVWRTCVWHMVEMLGENVNGHMAAMEMMSRDNSVECITTKSQLHRHSECGYIFLTKCAQHCKS